ncbi:hypothetical protein NC651_026398 [Populus alba x Populus x berolinensis]|nr:hypothetical protein NC651_026398 [Populus alba x Populus x berolinensis]
MVPDKSNLYIFLLQFFDAWTSFKHGIANAPPPSSLHIFSFHTPFFRSRVSF